MSLLSRYVGRIVLTSMSMVLVLLLGLDVVFSFLGELEDLKADYQHLKHSFLRCYLCRSDFVT